jgi:16S rRNA processing protein RimM
LTDHRSALSQNPPLAASKGRVRIGKIVRPHGLRGAVRVSLDNAASTILDAVERITVDSAGAPREYRIRNLSSAGRGVTRIELEGVTTYEAADALRGAILLVTEEDLPPADEGEFYDFRAIGCEVVTTAGRRLGTVVETFATGANDVLVVRDGAVELLIPVIADVIKNLDFAARRIAIEAVPGLLD